MTHLFTFRIGTQDLTVINEVLHQNEYGLPDSMEGQTVLDLGANIGCFAMACLGRGAKFVHCFEPEIENYQLLDRNLAPYEERVECELCAVWRSDEHNDLLRMHVEEGFTASTHCFGKGELTALRGLDDILREHETIDLLKIDIEGSEYPVLYTSKLLASKVKRIVGELHLAFKFKTPWPCSAEGMKGYLESLGFEVEIKMNFGNPKYVLGFEAVNKNLVPEECAA